MRKKKNIDQATTPTEEKVKKKPGRQPMTAEEKEAAVKARAAEKEKADKMKPELIVQYQGSDVDMSALVEAAKADFHQTKKRTLITSMKLYFKPEEKLLIMLSTRALREKSLSE